MSSNYLLHFLGFVGLITVWALGIVLMVKFKRIRQLEAETLRLKKNLDETDEQAKLIVRTDMELNRAQEELDKKITGLNTLQLLSRAISTTLEENQIFKRIEASYLEDLGFEKAAAYVWNDTLKQFQCALRLGYSDAEHEAISSFINFNKETYSSLILHEKTISTISVGHTAHLRDEIIYKFHVASFVLCPLLPKEGGKGFIFVGTENTDSPLTEGDEELITILANQLGQAMENARLFEKTWRAQQGLENKIEERTHQLSQVLEEVQRISKRKSDFVSSVSHELRTPLTSIKGYASILLTGKLGALPDEVRARIEKINRHSDELAQFVNDLLDISRIESGRVTMKLAAEDLTKIIEEVSDILSPLFKEKQIKFSFHLADEAKIVFADYGQIKRVFINLVNNAIKFTPPEGTIVIASRSLGKEIQVDTSDSGCGIPEQALGAIFEEFYRVDNYINQQVKGTGLGLSLVKNIIEAHHGKIWVKSKMDAGATFSFTLPKPA